MMRFICLLLLLCLQGVFAQKNYTFNLYTLYESKRDGNYYQQITLSDTIANNYHLTIYAKNNEIINVTMGDEEEGEIYRFMIYEKNFKKFELSDNLRNYEIFKISKRNFINRKFCRHHYTRNIIKLNDSVNEETFTFYKNRKKKKITSITSIQFQSLKNKKSPYFSEEVENITDCIDKSYDSKIIERINTKYFDGDKLRFEYSNNLVEMQPINFNFKIQE